VLVVTLDSSTSAFWHFTVDTHGFRPGWANIIWRKFGAFLFGAKRQKIFQFAHLGFNNMGGQITFKVDYGTIGSHYITT